MQPSSTCLHLYNLYAEKFRLFSPNARIVLVYSGLLGLAFGVSQLLFNFYVLSLGGYDAQFLGLLTSVSSLASLVMAIPAAYLADRFSHKWIMIIAGTLSALVFFGLVALPYRFFLILFYLINGIGTSVRQVTVAPFLMSHTSPEERQYVFSFNFGTVTTAGFVGNLLGGVLPSLVGKLVGVEATSTLAYQLTLGSMTAVGLLSVAPLFLIRDKPRDTSYRPEMPWTLIGRHGWQLFQMILPQLLIGLGAGLMQPFMNLYYRNVFQRSDVAIGILFGFGSLSMGLAQFIAPPMADRLGKINTVSLTQGLSVPFLLLLGVAAWVVPSGRGDINTWFIFAAIAFLIRLGLMNLSGPVYQTFVLEQVKPEIQTLAISLNSMVSLFGWAFSPSVSGYFQVTYAEFGFVPIFFTTAALYILGIGLVWAFFRNTEGRLRPRLSRQQIS